MNLTKRILLLSGVILLVVIFDPFFCSVKAQTSEKSAESSDATDVQQDEEEGKQIENPIKEIPGERSLEQEYDEHGIDWHDWAEKVAGAVWGPLIEKGAVAFGQSHVHWQVTSDCRVHIITVYSPIPGGAQVLVDSIKSLDRNPILAFPRGSKKTVVWRNANVGGRRTWHKIHRPIKVYP